MSKEKMKEVLVHYVVMEKHRVPESVCEKGYLAIEEYIGNEFDCETDTQKSLIRSESRDYEVVDVSD